jgi:hypothetical protein
MWVIIIIIIIIIKEANPSHSGGIDWKNHGSKSAWEKLRETPSQ